MAETVVLTGQAAYVEIFTDAGVFRIDTRSPVITCVIDANNAVQQWTAGHGTWDIAVAGSTPHSTVSLTREPGT